MNLLALDCSTDRLSLAVQHEDRVFTHHGLAGAQASATVIDAVLALLVQAKLPMASLQAIAFGRGPGAFTGLRTACSVAQGLALGAGLPLLPIDTLLCLAQATATTHTRVIAMLDARMGQVYAGAYERQADGWATLTAPMLCEPQDWVSPVAWQGLPRVLAGNALAVHESRLQPLVQACGTDPVTVWPEASAMLTLARLSWQRGQAVPAQDAMPVYVRDDVARTTAERLADKAANA
ncbi:MAG: tRNA (adenosine(37)-N6)-threonylcarbamoyltransferase complex dimerization subunit type 1 TsaB [Limnohabitans sp.]